MQICDRYSQSSVPRELLKQNGKRRLPENRREEGRVDMTPAPINFLDEYPPPPPPLLSRQKSGCYDRYKANGYSIAEILLVFGIIAGVLIGVWAMYTVLEEDAEVKRTVAAILMLREAATAYRFTNNNEYTDQQYFDFAKSGYVMDTPLAPYLGNADDRLAEIYVTVYGKSLGGNVVLSMGTVTNASVCEKILQHFGEVEIDEYTISYGTISNSYSHLVISDPIRGYVGGTGQLAPSQCDESYDGSGRQELTIGLE